MLFTWETFVLSSLALCGGVSACSQAEAETSTLRFYAVYTDANGNSVANFEGADKLPEGLTFYTDEQDEGLFVELPAVIDEQCMAEISPGTHPINAKPILNFTLDTPCAKTFAEFTANNIGRQFAVVLNGNLITVPRINGAIAGGSGFIEISTMTKSELEKLANSF